jgi:hypothetical protein
MAPLNLKKGVAATQRRNGAAADSLNQIEWSCWDPHLAAALENR